MKKMKVGHYFLTFLLTVFSFQMFLLINTLDRVEVSNMFLANYKINSALFAYSNTKKKMFLSTKN